MSLEQFRHGSLEYQKEHLLNNKDTLNKAFELVINPSRLANDIQLVFNQHQHNLKFHSSMSIKALYQELKDNTEKVLDEKPILIGLMAAMVCDMIMMERREVYDEGECMPFLIEDVPPAVLFSGRLCTSAPTFPPHPTSRQRRSISSDDETSSAGSPPRLLGSPSTSPTDTAPIEESKSCFRRRIANVRPGSS